MLYNERQEKIFKKVVKKLTYIEIDGESTQHLLQKIGQEEQMLRQLMMSMPMNLVNDYYNERLEYELNLDNNYIHPIKKDYEHRLKMINDDLRVIYSNISTEILNQATDHNDTLQQCFNNIEIACDLTNDESLSWKLYSDTNKTMGEKINDFLTKLDEEEEYFEFDQFQGTCHVVCSGSKTSINCTPFWDTDKDISIEVLENQETITNFFSIAYDEPKDDAELEKFKIFYIKLVKLFIKTLT